MLPSTAAPRPVHTFITFAPFLGWLLRGSWTSSGGVLGESWKVFCGFWAVLGVGSGGWIWKSQGGVLATGWVGFAGGARGALGAGAGQAAGGGFDLNFSCD